VDPGQLGLLINTGVHRDRHMVEPAMSSFIQQRIGANEEYDGTHSTFSFDLTNGGCGMLTGVMVADGFIRSGLTPYGMVVAGDAEPVLGLSDGYDITPSAAAILLAAGGDGEGFLAFKTETETQYLESFSARMEWRGEKKKQNRLVLRSSPSFAVECAACALKTLGAFLQERAMTLDDIDLLIPSQGPPGLVTEIGARSGLGDRLVDVTDRYGHPHTAGIGMALYHAIADGRFGQSRNVVFVGVGAGITVTSALYRNSLPL
jgi:3-oxoacyl-[acyl-carrier-protein] synthase-3